MRWLLFVFVIFCFFVFFFFVFLCYELPVELSVVGRPNWSKSSSSSLSSSHISAQLFSRPSSRHRAFLQLRAVIWNLGFQAVLLRFSTDVLLLVRIDLSVFIAGNTRSRSSGIENLCFARRLQQSIDVIFLKRRGGAA